MKEKKQPLGCAWDGFELEELQEKCPPVVEMHTKKELVSAVSPRASKKGAQRDRSTHVVCRGEVA